MHENNFQKKMWTKYLIERDFNPKRVLITGSVKVNESPYKVSNKKDFFTSEMLEKLEDQQAKRLTHVHNLLVKSKLNDLYFDINKNESKEEIFKLTADDLVFENKAAAKKAKQRAKFLK